MSAALMMAACTVAGCNIDNRASNGAPPTVVCGQTIAGGAAGSVVTDATQRGTVTVTELTPAGVILQVSKGCSTGATVSITPTSAVRIGPEAHAKDDGLAAIVLVPRVKDADVQIPVRTEPRPPSTSA